MGSQATRGMVRLQICRETPDGECVPAVGSQKITILKRGVVFTECATQAGDNLTVSLPSGSYTVLVNGGCATPLTVTQAGQDVRICSKCAT